ncbi:5745_t:CDS:2 [Gigaspora margarita]|uniref:5745_t:CDS:1 n=1 Tax=Gigaspora margarita TaxID=4874 RepID=A0ABN7UQY2_GIGMA|nr:5745_t:CDS:2 [Gigaspora margarita]
MRQKLFLQNCTTNDLRTPLLNLQKSQLIEGRTKDKFELADNQSLV